MTANQRLRAYVQHRSTCQSIGILQIDRVTYRWYPQRSVFNAASEVALPCDCGLDAALAALAADTGEGIEDTPDNMRRGRDGAWRYVDVNGDMWMLPSTGGEPWLPFRIVLEARACPCAAPAPHPKGEKEQ